MSVLFILFVILSIMFIAKIGWFAIIPIIIMFGIIGFVSDHMSEQEKKQK